MKPDSGFLKLQVADFVKGLLLAILTSVITIISTTIEAGSLTFDWKLIGKVALVSALGYLTKNLFTNNKGQFAAKDVPKS